MSAEEMKRLYGSLYHSNPGVSLDRRAVPEKLWPLLNYAAFWGIADDLTRENLLRQAPADVRLNLRQTVAAFDSALDERLAGPEADDLSPTDEYVAFSALRMAADYV